VCLVFVYRVKQRKLSKQMNERLEMLECEIRNEIRQGWSLLAAYKPLIENVGTIPFLDYKHFASRIFFPDVRKIVGFLLSRRNARNGSCMALAHLLRNKVFITSFVHTLEEQKNFTIKDKCTVASLLTIALHADLPYLTELMEDLLRALMEQSSNAQPKLMLRRTESIVEKLLTNWMSVCLYGFLRETVGQPLYLLVCALSQQINRGPVDRVTGKALYTLNEDWLLWQAQEFNAVVGIPPFLCESARVCSLDVVILDCDTVDQVKEKILEAFKSKFGFPYSKPLGEIDVGKPGADFGKGTVTRTLHLLSEMHNIGVTVGVWWRNGFGRVLLSGGSGVRIPLRGALRWTGVPSRVRPLPLQPCALCCHDPTRD
uniref:Plexin cytoplasmic RasGAP domain-containing protein n=1 Tax=Scleropages formosus TaxID=113540 RepID=A0A8C9U3I1_SCLFO